MVILYTCINRHAIMFNVLSLQLKRLRWHNETAIDFLPRDHGLLPCDHGLDF